MNHGDQVRYLNFRNKIDSTICVVEEIQGDILRLKKPSGEIIRIYKDRVYSLDELDGEEYELDNTEQAEETDAEQVDTSNNQQLNSENVEHSEPEPEPEPEPELKPEQNESTTSKPVVQESDNKKKFDPWQFVGPNGEVFIKNNNFDHNNLCQSVTMIDPDSNIYKNLNIYDGCSDGRGICEYHLKDINKLKKKLEKKGYTQIQRSSN